MIKLEKKLPAPKGQDIIKAEAGLTGVRRAAIAAGHRMAALEREAENIHVKTMLACTARVTSTPKHGVHALLVDDNGVTVEISGGAVAVAVAKEG